MAAQRPRNNHRWEKQRAHLIRQAQRRGDGCALCGAPIDWTTTGRGPWSPEVDHVIPRSEGGSDRADNQQITHGFCNRWRQARPIEQAQAEAPRAATAERARLIALEQFDRLNNAMPTSAPGTPKTQPMQRTECSTCDHGDTLPISRNWLGDATPCQRGMLHRPAGL